MTTIPNLAKMIEQRDSDEADNRASLQQAKRIFDEEKARINNTFLEEAEWVIEAVKGKLSDESTFEDLMNDKEFTSNMLPYLREIRLDKLFLQKFRTAFSDSFHMDFLEIPEVSITWYQSPDIYLGKLDEINHQGVVGSIPYSHLIKIWLSTGVNYSFDLSLENDDIEIGFDRQTEEWFISHIERSNGEGYPVYPSPPVDRFSEYAELVKFIENNSFSQNS